MFIIDNPQLCLYSFINPDAIYFTLILNQNRQGQAYKCKLVLNYDLLNNLPEGKSQNHSIFLHRSRLHTPTSKPYARKMRIFLEGKIFKT
jgi:hypothetical protein